MNKFNKEVVPGAARRGESRRGVFLKMGERVKKNFLKCIFSENRRKFEGDFLPKSGKFE
jgi:hypothetical protein